MGEEKGWGEYSSVWFASEDTLLRGRTRKTTAREIGLPPSALAARWIESKGESETESDVNERKRDRNENATGDRGD